MFARLRIVAVAILSAAALGVGLTPGVSAQPYELQPGDIVEITVLEDPSLNRRVLIGPDGAIALPLAGEVTAGGKTLGAVQSAISARLRGQFVNPPSVTVSLVALGPPSLDQPGDDAEAEEEEDLGIFYVLGEVNQPGRFGFKRDEPITILQALAQAGGVGVFAARSRIQVRSHAPIEDPDAPASDEAAADDAAADAKETADAESDVEEEKAPPRPLVETLRLFNYAALEDGEANAMPMFIQDGDVIIVPERGLLE